MWHNVNFLPSTKEFQESTCSIYLFQFHVQALYIEKATNDNGNSVSHCPDSIVEDQETAIPNNILSWKRFFLFSKFQPKQ